MTAQPQSWIAENQASVIRRATTADAEVCGRICFEAFGALAKKHSFPNDFPAPEIPAHVLSTMFSHPSFFCVVAEQEGKIIGSNCLDERTPIAGVGPITIAPGTQNRTVVGSAVLVIIGVALIVLAPAKQSVEHVSAAVV
jgi:hypothetical protein